MTIPPLRTRPVLQAAVAALLLTANTAPAITIFFDDLQSMPNAGPAAIPANARLSNQYLNTYGVVFSSGSPYVPVVNVGSHAMPSGANGIGGSTPGGFLTYSANYPIVATFFDPSNPLTPATTDFVSLQIDFFGTSGMNVHLQAYNLAGNLIANHTVFDTGGATLQVSAPGIHRVQFIGTADNTGAAVDNFAFNAVVPVPEPSSLVLAIVGGALAAVCRRSPRLKAL